MFHYLLVNNDAAKHYLKTVFYVRKCIFFKYTCRPTLSTICLSICFFCICCRWRESIAIMVINILYDCWVETGLSFYLKAAIVILEYVLTKSPSDFQIKLILIRLYNKLGEYDVNTGFTK